MKKVETKTNAHGVVQYRLIVRLRSKLDPNVRIQEKSNWYSTEKEAQNQERKLTQLIERTLNLKEHEGCSWGHIVERWEQALLAGRGLGRNVSAATAENYIHGLRTHTNDWWKAPASQINRADVRELYIKLDERGHSRSMQQKMRSAVNGAFTWAIETRLIHGIYQSPANGVALIGKKEEKRSEILTSTEIRKLLEFSEQYNHSWQPIWKVALMTGMRNGELHALEWSDVDFDNRLIHVHRSYDTKTRSVGPTKSRDWRQIPISSELEIVLKELKVSSGARSNVLPRMVDWDRGSQAKVLRTFCLGIGIPSIKFHTLRACFATQLLRDGVAPGVVMTICGWKDLETMQIYIRRAGIDIAGATDGLRLLTPREAMGRVVDLFKGS